MGDSSLEITQYIASNHINICRFSGFYDVEYRKVITALKYVQKRIIEESANLVSLDSCAAFVTLIYLIDYIRNKLNTRRRLLISFYEISTISRNRRSLCDNKNGLYQNVQIIA